MNNGRSVILGSGIVTILAIVVLAAAVLQQQVTNQASVSNSYINSNDKQHSDVKIVTGKGNANSESEGGLGGNANGGEAGITDK